MAKPQRASDRLIKGKAKSITATDSNRILLICLAPRHVQRNPGSRPCLLGEYQFGVGDIITRYQLTMNLHFYYL